MIKIKRGMDIPIQGAPQQVIEDAPAARAVALVGFDYVGMKPTMEVKEGDRVKLGQVLFTDKKTEGVRYTAPASGVVSAVNRGAKRVLQSVVIDVDGDDAEDFGASSAADAANLDAAAVRAKLIESGQWTALRTRPFSKVPEVDSEAAAIFVTAMDTQPLAADPAVIIDTQVEAFTLGQDLLAKLTNGKVYVCAAADVSIPLGKSGKVQYAQFDGPHPAGLAGTHIHFLEGASNGKTVWQVGYQDVIAIGRLFLDGKLYTDRVISLAGPQVENPRLVKTRLGVDLQALCAGEVKEGENRIISGSVLGGRGVATGTSYLGRYHNQVSVLLEGRQRDFMGWLSPGASRHSSLGIYLSSFFGVKPLPMTTNTNGSERAMVPVGQYENIMPLDILPTQLLRSLIVGDTETAQALGCLELEEEDLALCTYVCAGKYEYGPILRDNLTRIEKEG
ncbi:NADH:ubiquinone reductase (Na(+)-transporting) subunit A [Halioglobus japonicus]|uniref:Na(+)-translocating NADH-quinone reductase subunit A n=1 Tax=Halioglobus japonicus TaxID=930805 RepID=A0AAP8MFM8_9GAMM|nr:MULTISPECIES: Na(+)-translocating NADH-quinone reductase subunit A [Halioglobus]AQA18754.1 NADH:ubiquinone reductase (Na(+)-transporting) subunit A [Halioglobus japonicus]KZX60212.1 NADH:ubiquinone reductase (Na(+)-transporting) subunit A [Halioglobus sp. HI00S01]PLW86784.1 Na(+)-translocating NADH-quinone reductase subunit A [Halioglobus japonicus]GHD11084.1 Na(+)-translocating NADH-quinone reductase subunit A [Halioglobus japonicus]